MMRCWSSCFRNDWWFVVGISLWSWSLLSDRLDELWSRYTETSCSLLVSGLWRDSSKLGGISNVSVTSGLASNSDDSCVDGARDAVLVLDEDFWNIKLRFIVSAVVLKILFGWLVHNCFLNESFDGFILGEHPSAVKASDGIRVTLILFISTVISSLLWHLSW